MYVLHLLNLNFSRSDCATIVGCHINSVTNYIKMYNEGGLDQIRQLNYSRNRHELGAQFTQVEQQLTKANCNTVVDAKALLKDQFNYDKSKESIRRLLHRLGFKRRKVGTFPGKTKNLDEWYQKQNVFAKKLYKLIKRAEKAEIDLVFSDAAHFVYGKFSSYCWGKAPRYAPSGHGRFRINVYGSYDVVSNQVYTMYNEGYINAEFIVDYFDWLRSEIYPNRRRPLHMVMDNARYQHCKYVKAAAKKHHIILDFLPGYCPHLNLIERLWKYMKKILGQSYHQDKKSFKQEIVTLLNDLSRQDHQEKIWTLLNPIFQQFPKSQILGW